MALMPLGEDRSVTDEGGVKGRGTTGATRRFADLAIIAFAALALALPGAILMIHGEPDVAGEQRSPAPPPAWPKSLSGWQRFTAAADAYLVDRFGLRGRLVQFRTRAVIALGDDRLHDAAIGRDGSIFGPMSFTRDIYRGKIGALDPKAAGMIDRIVGAAELIRNAGSKVFIVVAPEKGSFHPGRLPAWAAPSRHRAPFSDQVIAELRRRTTVTVVDVRPALAAFDRVAPAYFRADSHWTPRGALAAFEAIAAAMRREGIAIAAIADDEMNQERVPWRGDLLGFIGLVSAHDEDIDIPRPRRLPPPTDGNPEFFAEICRLPRGAADLPANCVQRGTGGPTIAVLGDSFSSFWSRAVKIRTRESYWLYHSSGDIDLDAVLRRRPDAVILEFVERFIPIAAGDFGVGRAQARALALSTDAGGVTTIASLHAPPARLEAGSVGGSVDHVGEAGEYVVLSGWAYRKGGTPPPVLVALVAGTRGLNSARTLEHRPDVAAALRDPAATSAGFAIVASRSELAGCPDAGWLKVVAVTAAGQASILPLSSQARDALARLAASGARRC